MSAPATPPPGSAPLEATLEADVAVITLNRPARRNALTRSMRRDLAALLRHHGDGHRARGIVVTGRGDAFSAGLDLREAARAPLDLPAEMESFHDITRAALAAEVPVVAALNGVAVGGAAEMALSFDARLAAPGAALVWPENAIGLTVSNAASLFLPRLAGQARATELVLGSARVSAPAALGLGLLDAVTEPEDLLPAARRLIHRWTPSGSATAAHLRLLRPDMDAVERAMARETEAVRRVQAAGIARAGIEAVLARRR
ncbi:enoyl-CoA hydratase/isomerase family protein [Streptomyces sp. PRKS01-65]|nr:enoyl-CoA hydratase/isomerase family protein [Streptomyces harenosi]NEY31646.1 enoyl-CoA hydratase/isomerase family protein [Streptomyces harenosi]